MERHDLRPTNAETTNDERDRERNHRCRLVSGGRARGPSRCRCPKPGCFRRSISRKLLLIRDGSDIPKLARLRRLASAWIGPGSARVSRAALGVSPRVVRRAWAGRPSRHARRVCSPDHRHRLRPCPGACSGDSYCRQKWRRLPACIDRGSRPGGLCYEAPSSY